MAQVTLLDIKTRALDLADIPSTSSWITDARLTDAVNDGLSDLHDILVETYQDVLTFTAQVPLAAGTEFINLPVDFFKVRKVFILDGSTRRELEQFTLDDLDGRDNDETSSRPGYRLIGNKMWFHPRPESSTTVDLWYVRNFQPLIDDTDEVSPMLERGWELFVVAHVAAYLLAREESDPSYALATKAEARARIQSASRHRDASGPQKVRDVSRRFAGLKWFDKEAR